MRSKPQPKFARPPCEQKGADYSAYSKAFQDVIFRFMPLKEREQWMSSPELANFGAFQCGFFNKARGHCWERQGLAEGVYIYCVAGKGHYSQGEKNWEVGPGDLLYCFPNTHHSYSADSEEPWTIYWVHVSGSRMAHFEQLLGLSIEAPVIALGIHSEIIQLFRSLFTLFRPASSPARFLAIWACAQHLLATMAIVSRPFCLPPQREQEIQAVLDHLDRSLQTNPRLGDLAKFMGVSPFHFSRIFKAATGLPPIEYFINLKVRRACLLLETSPLKIKEVARQLGFEDPYYFSRLFKRITGVSPDEYRKKLTSNSRHSSFKIGNYEL